jgi:hypothetical protein
MDGGPRRVGTGLVSDVEGGWNRKAGDGMAACDACGTTILFGGVKQGPLRFCNQQCAQRGLGLSVANQLPADLVEKQVRQVHQGNCPRCQGPGPVDIHTSHRVWSAIAMTRWSSHPVLCCRSCGTKAKLGSAVFSMSLGWWGFPFGLLLTPVQLGRNVIGLFGGPDPATPSPALERAVRLHLASALAAQSQRPTAQG